MLTEVERRGERLARFRPRTLPIGLARVRGAKYAAELAGLYQVRCTLKLECHALRGRAIRELPSIGEIG